MYLVDGRRYGPDEHGLERALDAAYDDRIRPLCLCCDPAVPVYITRLGGTFVLKRMPFTGSQHAVGCTHYEPPAELSGLGEVLGTAISEDPDTGVTQLRVGFSLSKGAPRAVDAGAGQDSGSVRSDGTRLSLRGLLHLLWHEAELTRWHPGFLGKRSWAVVRGHLLSAVANMFVSGASLGDLLYVPEVFTVNDREGINSRRARRFAAGLQPHRARRPMMILIGEIKEIIPTRFHFKAVVKHAPDLAFLLDSQLHRRMVRRFEPELLLWGASENIRMIMMATFALSDAGLPTIEELSLMPTTPQWLPVEDSYELQLVNRLASSGRTFEKALRFNSKLESSRSSVILFDTKASPTAMYIDRGEEGSVDGCSTNIAGDQLGLPQWRWSVQRSDLPPFPPHRAQADPAAADNDSPSRESIGPGRQRAVGAISGAVS